MKKHPFLVALAGLALSLVPALSFAVTKVACVGDSITFGYQIPNREAFNYPKFLGELLGPDFEVRNFGNSGKTAGDYPGQKARKRWYGDNVEHKAASEWGADIYICNLGINDTGAWWDEKLFVSGYERLIKDWRAKRKNVPLMIWTKLAPDFRGPVGAETFPGNVFEPEFKFPLRDNGSAKNRPAAEKLLAALAEKQKARPMDAFTQLKDHPEFYLPDGLHPNAAGAKRIAEVTFAELVRAGFPKVKIPRGKAPTLEIGSDEKTVVLKNPNKTAVLLDGVWMLVGGNASFVFENATVIPPEGEIVVALAGAEDQKDPGKPLVSSALKKASSVKLVEVKGKKR